MSTIKTPRYNVVSPRGVFTLVGFPLGTVITRNPAAATRTITLPDGRSQEVSDLDLIRAGAVWFEDSPDVARPFARRALGGPVVGEGPQDPTPEAAAIPGPDPATCPISGAPCPSESVCRTVCLYRGMARG